MIKIDLNINEGSFKGLGNFLNQYGLFLLVFLLIIGGSFLFYSLYQENDALADSINILNGKVSELEKDKTTLLAIASGMNEEITTYQKLVADSEEKIAGLEEESAMLASLKKSNARLINELKENQSTLSSVKGSTQKILRDKEKAFKELEELFKSEKQHLEQIKKKYQSAISSNELLQKQQNQMSLKVDSLSKALGKIRVDYQSILDQTTIMPLKANIKLKTFSNGYIDPDSKLEITQKASKVEQVRVQFTLSRPIQKNDRLCIQLNGMNYTSMQAITALHITNQINGHLDFTFRRRTLKKGTLTAKIMNHDQVINHLTVQLE